METLTTQGIRISVEPFYLPHESIPIQHRYVFAYRVTIQNQSTEIVQLLRRHWHIIESNGVRREVEGEGVVEVGVGRGDELLARVPAGSQ